MKTTFFSCLTFFLLATSALTFANDNAQKAIAKAQYMMKQLNAEKMALQTENSRILQELEELKKSHADDMKKAEKKEKKLKGTLGVWKEEYTILKEKLAELTGLYRQTVVEREGYKENLIAQTDNFRNCTNHNHELVNINYSLLEKFNNKSAWDALKQKEPLTGLSKVRVENIMQEYKFAIEDEDLALNNHEIHSVKTPDREDGVMTAADSDESTNNE